ncbi:MAG: shikimate kinase [Clostridia bacterium]
MKYGLIGEHLKHSFSKPIHEKLADYDYIITEIEKDKLDDFMMAKTFECINVTIPYKQDVIKHLYTIDEHAKSIGAVNTIVNRDGKLYGYNTDFGGMSKLIERNGFDFSGKKIVILGSGGTAKTALAVSKYLAAKQVLVVSRTGETNYETLYSEHTDADFIINTTPVGMYPNNYASPVDLSKFTNLQGVLDAIYNPLQTKLCQDAEKLGIKSDCGLYMLVYQAVLACEIFTDSKIDDSKTDEIFNQIISEKQNIVLTGMPASGKSTVGAILAKELGKDFVDTDEMIVENAKMPISEIFKKHGEKHFRELETDAVKEASKLSSTIIATGGGAVLKTENIDALKMNGKVFFLNRDLNDLVPTDDRPLGSDFEALKQRYNERFDIYMASADKEIKVDCDAQGVANKIMESIK